MKNITTVKKSFAAAASVVAASGVLLLAQPASAAPATQVTSSYKGANVAADNNPGNGAAGWVWANVGGGLPAGYHYAAIKYTLTDGEAGTLKTSSSASRNLPFDVKSFQACIVGTFDGIDVYSCGSTVNM